MNKEERLQRSAERRDLTQGPITKKIVLFSLPIIFGNLFQQLYNVVDSVVVGNFAADGTHCLAAVNASFAIMMVFNALYMGVSMGANIVISSAAACASAARAFFTAWVSWPGMPAAFVPGRME